MSAPIQINEEDLANADNIDFDDSTEHWNIYKLKDGSTLKVKMVLNGVKRLKKYNPDGTPIYIINSQNIVRVVEIPQTLLAKRKEPNFKPV